MIELQPGDPGSIGDYRLRARLGAGGMGVVYLASDRSGREVALKLIREDLAAHAGFRARFAREVRAGRQVGGQWTAHYLDADVDAGRPYLVSEYVPGGNLAAYVALHGRLEGDLLIGLAVGLAEGLAAMGAVGVIHRDLKPSNVLMGDQGPKIIDFGISVAADGTSLTQTGAVVGSPAWMAPEQAQGREATAAVDIFSWAATLAFAATGRHPFGEGRPDAVLYRVVHEEPELTGMDPRLILIVRAALTKDPAGRPSADALLRAVRTLGPPVVASPPIASEATSAPTSVLPPGLVPEASVTDVIEHTRDLPRSPKPRRRGRQFALAGTALVIMAAFIAGALFIAHITSTSNNHDAVSHQGSAASHGSDTKTSTTGAGTTTSPSAATNPTADISASLPVVACPTSFAVELPSVSKKLPSLVQASVPANLASQLSVYADQAGDMGLLAPRGWDCKASFGADGSSVESVIPHGQVLPRGGVLSSGSRVEAIVGTQNGGCEGCAASQACPFFTSADEADPFDCINATPPSGEVVTRLASNIVGFEDPPGLAGDANPSGGAYPANAVMTFTHDPRGSSGDFWSSWLETCTLPNGQHTLCTAVLNDFASRYKDS
jgi:serine/threonine protein kinase